MQLVLPFPEALELATAEKPLPAAVQEIYCRGDTVFVTLSPETVLPKALRAVAPRVRLELRFLHFQSGTVTFELVTNVLSLPVHRLLNFITKALPLPEGVRLEQGERAPQVVVDVQRLISQQVGGLTLNEFYLHNGDLIAVATLHNFRTYSTSA